jgi:hypothetical protein
MEDNEGPGGAEARFYTFSRHIKSSQSMTTCTLYHQENSIDACRRNHIFIPGHCKIDIFLLTADQIKQMH